MGATSADADTGVPAHRMRWRTLRAAWQIVKNTVRACLRYRVTGLAAEGAFFAILSLPPLIFGLAGTLGYVAKIFGGQTVTEVKRGIVEGARQALTEDSVQSIIVPSLDAVLDRGRADVISIGFLIALWSGSRALNVIMDTITIMYGLGGHRGIVKTRTLSFSMYVIALGVGVVVLPLVLAGPDIVDSVLPDRLDVLNQLYWPTVVLLSTMFLATLYHVAVPVRKSWRHALAGSVLVLGIWIGGSYALRWVLGNSVGGTSIYGPLAAPIVVLIWLYLITIAVLIGAAFNAAFDAELTTLRAERERMRAAAANVSRARTGAAPAVAPDAASGGAGTAASATPPDADHRSASQPPSQAPQSSHRPQASAAPANGEPGTPGPPGREQAPRTRPAAPSTPPTPYADGAGAAPPAHEREGRPPAAG